LPVSSDEPAIGSLDFCYDEECAVLKSLLEDLLESAFFAPALPPFLVGKTNTSFCLSQGESPFSPFGRNGHGDKKHLVKAYSFGSKVRRNGPTRNFNFVPSRTVMVHREGMKTQPQDYRLQGSIHGLSFLLAIRLLICQRNDG
jgi:hypothetical protein